MPFARECILVKSVVSSKTVRRLPVLDIVKSMHVAIQCCHR